MSRAFVRGRNEQMLGDENSVPPEISRQIDTQGHRGLTAFQLVNGQK